MAVFKYQFDLLKRDQNIQINLSLLDSMYWSDIRAEKHWIGVAQ